MAWRSISSGDLRGLGGVNAAEVVAGAGATHTLKLGVGFIVVHVKYIRCSDEGANALRT